MRRYAGLALLIAFAWPSFSFAQINPPPASTPTPQSNPANQPAQNAGAQGGASTRSVVCVIAYQSPGSPTKTQKVDADIMPSNEWLSDSSICKNNPSDDKAISDATAGLNDTLYFLVDFGGTSLGTSDKVPPDIDTWRISINGIEIDDGSLNWLQYDQTKPYAIMSARLLRTDASKAAWNQILARKFGNQLSPVTIIDDSKKPLSSHAYFHLQVLKFNNFYAWALLAILLLLLIMLLTNDRLKDLLRDDGDVKTSPTGSMTAAYSLARFQVLFWFSIVIVSYAAIWIVTGDRDTINNDVLTLMGISSSTLLGAVAIDSNKKSSAQAALPDATAKLQQANAIAAALATTVGAGQPATIAAAHSADLQQKAVVQLNDRTLADYHDSFLSDLLCDENGLSFHRFQMFSWTLVLGVIFVASVIQTLSMPTFGNTLLGLMGISGGTYLGFKFPEQKTQ